MNFKILCRSFEARTQALSDKTNRIKIGQEMTKKQTYILSPDGRTYTHTYGASFIVPSLTSLGGDKNGTVRRKKYSR